MGQALATQQISLQRKQNLPKIRLIQWLFSLIYWKILMRTTMIIAAALISLPASAQEDRQTTSFIANYGSGKYIIRASETGVLSIDCLERCSAPFTIKDNIGRTNIGIFRLNDANNLLFTTWVGGSSYRTVIYNIDGKKTKKVLDEYAIAGMDFIGSNAGNVVVRIPQFISNRDKRRVVRSWRWNSRAGRFQR